MEADQASAQRALLLQHQGRHSQAIDQWNLVLAAQPGDAVALANRALCHLELEQLDAAEADSVAALGAAPDWDQAHRTHALVLRDRHRLGKAILAAAEAARLDPEDADNHAFIAELALDNRQWTKALDATTAGLACQPDHLPCLNLRAIALRQLGRDDEADAAIAGALQRSPNSAPSHANQGWSLLHQGQPKAAEAHFLEALRLNPDYEWARSGLVTSLKAHSFIYRQILAYQFWVSRLRQTSGFAIPVVTYLAYRLIMKSLEGTVLFWPALIVILGAFLLTWIANPLGNVMLLFHPRGRLALSRTERAGALLVGGLLGLSVLLVVWAILCPVPPLIYAPIFACQAALIASSVFLSNPGWPRRLNAVFVLVPLAMMVFMVLIWLLHITALAGHFMPGLIAIFTWIESFGWMINLGLLYACQFVASIVPRR